MRARADRGRSASAARCLPMEILTNTDIPLPSVRCGRGTVRAPHGPRTLRVRSASPAEEHRNYLHRPSPFAPAADGGPSALRPDDGWMRHSQCGQRTVPAGKPASGLKVIKAVWTGNQQSCHAPEWIPPRQPHGAMSQFSNPGFPKERLAAETAGRQVTTSTEGHRTLRPSVCHSGDFGGT